MNKSDLKALVKEVVNEVEKFGKKNYRAVAIKNFTDEMGVSHKKGDSIPISGIDQDGSPYVVAGHGLDYGYPKDAVKVITNQSQLPPELQKRFSGVKQLLNALIKNKAAYYSDVLSDEYVKKFVDDVKKQLDTLVKVKSPDRKQ